MSQAHAPSSSMTVALFNLDNAPLIAPPSSASTIPPPAEAQPSVASVRGTVQWRTVATVRRSPGQRGAEALRS